MHEVIHAASCKLHAPHAVVPGRDGDRWDRAMIVGRARRAIGDIHEVRISKCRAGNHCIPYLGTRTYIRRNKRPVALRGWLDTAEFRA